VARSECRGRFHTIGEIQAGIGFLPDGAKKRALQAWLNGLMDAMEGRF
jgi:predicted ribonuclease YlaK